MAYGGRLDDRYNHSAGRNRSRFLRGFYVVAVMLGAIISFFTSGGVSGIAEQLRLANRDRLDAQTDAAKLAADENIARLNAAMSAQTTGQATWVPKLIRALWVAPLIVYLWKLIIWDKLLGWGVTDGLGAFELYVAQAAITFYFITGAIQVLRR